VAYALIGTPASASSGPSSILPTWGTGLNRTTGNLLICPCSVTGSAVLLTTPSGWTVATQFNPTSCSANIYYRIATGGDTAPTITIPAGTGAAQLLEFSGNSATPLDKFGTAGSASSPTTATLTAADTASGELFIVCGADIRSAARTPSDTWTSNHATITLAGNNNAISTTNHYSFGYALATTSNTGANTAVLTASVTTSLTQLGVVAATFLLAPVVEIPLPELILQPMRPANLSRMR
jgi:hypothetical protein